jgi:hypothetical protein
MLLDVSKYLLDRPSAINNLDPARLGNRNLEKTVTHATMKGRWLRLQPVTLPAKPCGGYR